MTLLKKPTQASIKTSKGKPLLSEAPPLDSPSNMTPVNGTIGRPRIRQLPTQKKNNLAVAT